MAQLEKMKERIERNEQKEAQAHLGLPFTLPGKEEAD